jgi:hypothetical protein
VRRTDRPRDPKNVLLEAELLASSPERVRAWLEESAAKTDALSSNEERIEQALLARGDPLISLSLARFSGNADILQALLTGLGKESKAIRLASLVNESVGRHSFSGIPRALVGPNAQIADLLSSLDEEEITALFSNPTVEEDFLIDFFEMKAPWKALDEERQLAALRALYKNYRITSDYSGPMDGYAEYRHDKVFDAAWTLAEKLPVKDEWAGHLCWLYERLKPTAHSLKSPLQLSARWVPDASDTKRIEHERKELECGTLGVYARTRRGIARLSVLAAHSKEARQMLLTHEDPAVRAAFYFEGELSVEEMKAANHRDFLLCFDQMIWNPRVWHSKATRDALREMAWQTERDPQARLDPQNMYKARCEYWQKKYPDWFIDEEQGQQPDPGEQPVASETFSGSLEAVKSDLVTSNDLARATYQAQLKLLKRTAWIGWGVAAVLAVLLIHRY